MLKMSFISFWYFLFMKEYQKNILKILLQKNLLHSNLFNYSLHICRLGNIFINAQSLERKNSLTYMCKIIIIIIIINLICTSVLICSFNTKIWGVKIEICNRDAIPLCMYCISKIYVWYSTMLNLWTVWFLLTNNTILTFISPGLKALMSAFLITCCPSSVGLFICL